MSTQGDAPILGQTSDPPPEPPRRRLLIGGTTVADMWFVGSMVLLVLIGLGYIVAHRDWHPISDWALTDLEALRTREELPLIGSYSRLGWSHPGPAFTLLMAASITLAGGISAGMMLGMLVLHVASLILAWLAVRPQGIAAAVLVTSALLLTWAVGTNTTGMLHPWNPYTSLVAAGALLALAWNAVSRFPLGPAVMLPLASVLVQSHIGAALFASAVCVAALIMSALPRRQPRRFPWRAWLAGAVVTALMWLPPLIDQFTAETGNVTRILTTPQTTILGFGAGWAALTNSFALPPGWSSPTLQWISGDPAVPWLVALPIAATAVATATRHRVGLEAMALCWAGILAIVPTVARLDEPFGYLVQWVPAVVTVSLAVSCWVLLVATGTDRFIGALAPVLIALPPPLWRAAS